MNLKYQLRHGMEKFMYLLDHILYQILEITLNISKKHGERTDNPSIKLYVNKMENRVTFKIKTGYQLELLTPETMKLLGSTEKKISKKKKKKKIVKTLLN